MILKKISFAERILAASKKLFLSEMFLLMKIKMQKDFFRLNDFIATQKFVWTQNALSSGSLKNVVLSFIKHKIVEFEHGEIFFRSLS